MRSLALLVLASVIWVEQLEKRQFRTGETQGADPIEGELDEGKQIVGLFIPELLLLLLRLLRAAEFRLQEGCVKRSLLPFFSIFFLPFLIYFTPFSQFFLLLLLLLFGLFFFKIGLCFILFYSFFFFFFFLIFVEFLFSVIFFLLFFPKEDVFYPSFFFFSFF
jgi:hypothetical protein